MHKKLQLFVFAWLFVFIVMHSFLKIKNFHSPESLYEQNGPHNQNEMSMLFQSNNISLDQLQESIPEHQLTILSFWETWCLPCAEEMPLLQKIVRTYPDLQVIGIYQSSKEDAVQRFVLQHQILFPLYKDTSKTLFQQHAVENYPTLIVINAEGKTMFRKSGFKQYNDGSDSLEELRQFIQNQLGTSL